MSLLFACVFALGQPNTEVYLFDISVQDEISISNPRNVSNNPGYDNQPSFTQNGKFLLFSSTRNDQTDILRYDLGSDAKTWLSDTPGGEYSPTQTPDEDFVSSIMLEPDGRQLLWKFPLDPGEGEILVPYLKIGYHTWLNESRLFAFVLGQTMTLQDIDLKTQRAEIIRENIGRSLHKVPGEEKISFVDKNSDTWSVFTYEPSTSTFDSLIATPEGSEDMTWLKKGGIIIGDDSRILFWDGKEDSGWKEVADLSDYGMSGISRLTVNRNQSLLAVVVNGN